MSVFGGKIRICVIIAAMALISCGALIGLTGCGGEGRDYYPGDSEYSRLMNDALRRGDTRYMAEEFLPQ